jgi:protein-tyrosine phosphatase
MNNGCFLFENRSTKKKKRKRSDQRTDVNEGRESNPKKNKQSKKTDKTRKTKVAGNHQDDDSNDIDTDVDMKSESVSDTRETNTVSEQQVKTWLNTKDYDPSHQRPVLFMEYVHDVTDVTYHEEVKSKTTPGDDTRYQRVRGACPVYLRSQYDKELTIASSRTDFFALEVFEYLRNDLSQRHSFDTRPVVYKTAVVYARDSLQTIPDHHIQELKSRLPHINITAIAGSLPRPLPVHRQLYDMHAFVRATIDKYVDVKKKQGHISRDYRGPIEWNAILPGRLYVSNLEAANEPEFLKSQNIGAIVSIGGGLSKQTLERKDTVIIRADFEDRLEQSADKMATFLTTEAIPFMKDMAAAGRVILVHCTAGISRSPTVAMAFVMEHLGVSLREALVIVMYHRHATDPCAMFLHVLQNWFMDRTSTKVLFPPQPMDFLEFQLLRRTTREVCNEQDSSIPCCWCREKKEELI